MSLLSVFSGILAALAGITFVVVSLMEHVEDLGGYSKRRTLIALSIVACTFALISGLTASV